MRCAQSFEWFTGLILLVAVGAPWAHGAEAQSAAVPDDPWLARGYQVQEVSAQQLRTSWQAVGKGRMSENHEQLVMSELDGSVGYMLVSPQVYGDHVVVRFEVLVLRPASVLVVNLAASNGPDGALTFPEDYNSNVKYLFDNLQMYMLVAHNAPHNKPGPFIRRYPQPGNPPIAASSQQIIRTGQYHQVEVGQEGGKIWYKIDGKTIVTAQDAQPLGPGKVILRIRGTGHETASVLLRNVRIYSK
jgi:hypothetical protein